MRIAITADVPEENAPVSVVFGRCPYYAIYDTATDRIEFVPNPGGISARGAGVQAGQFLLTQGVEMVITGGVVGPNASMVLSQGGIRVINGFQGSVKDAINAVKNGNIKSIQPPPMYPPQPYPPYQQYYPPQEMPPEEEIKMLEEEKSRIEERLEEIKKRLKELNK